MKRTSSLRQVVQRPDAERIAGRDEQPLRTRHQTDHPVRTRLQVAPEPRSQFRRHAPGRQVKAAQVASTVRHRSQRIDRAEVLQLEPHGGLALDQAGQQRDRVAMAGMQAQHRVRIHQRRIYFAVDFHRQVFQLRRQSRLYALRRPGQLLAQRRQFRALALRQLDQRRAEEGRPGADQIPAVTVGKPDVARRLGQLSAALYGGQHAGTARVDFAAFGIAETPGRFDLDAHVRHLFSYR
jgi:predicted pyridoxine 5'-phosphate oxidase superfamily flavin-nucleotide-binding protein